MKAGDKIKLVRDKEEGVIVQAKGKGIFEIELEDGFNLEVHFSEITLMASDDAVMGEEEPEPVFEPKKEIEVKEQTEENVFLLFKIEGKHLEVELINTTKTDYHIAYYRKERNSVQPQRAFVLEKERSVALKDISMTTIQSNVSLIFQYLPFDINSNGLLHPGQWSQKLTGDLLMKKDETIAGINKKGKVIRFVELHQDINVEELKMNMFSSTAIPEPEPELLHANRQLEIDLHIENLVNDIASTPREDYLSIQLKSFENELDKAIVRSQDHITFIHGVGDGILRHQIHKHLSGHPHISFFKDANKEKFGYGATYIELK